MASGVLLLQRAGLERLRRTSRRERWLLAALAGAALLYAPFAAAGWAEARRAELAEQRVRLQQLLEADDARRLAGVAARLGALRAKVDGWSTPAPSFAVARVLAEQRVTSSAVRAGLSGVEVRSAETPDVVGRSTWVRVELASSFTWTGFAALMRGLADSGGVVAETATLDRSSDLPRLRLVLLTPFRTPGGR